jgi:signal transduction histidine kinase
MIANHFIVSAYCTSLTTLVLAFFVLGRDVSKRLYQLFFAYTLSIALWSFAVSRFTPDISSSSAFYWGKILHFGAIMIPIFFLHFVFVFLDTINNEKWVLSIAYLFGIAFQLLNLFTPWLISGTSYKDLYSFPTPGITYPFFFAFFVLCVLYGLFSLLRAYVGSKGIVKNQLIYLIFGSIIGYTGGLDNFAITIDLRIFPLYPFGAYGIAIYTLMMAYTILRHRLMDIAVVIKKTAVYSLLTALITGVFVSLIVIGNYIFSGITGYNSLWAGIVGAFLIALVFQPLREFVQDVVDRVFFRARYDYQRILAKYSHTLSQPMTNLNRFSRIAPYLLTKAMKLAGSSFMVLDRENHNYVVRAGEKAARKIEGQVLAEGSALIQELRTKKKEVSLEEVEALIKEGGPDKKKYEEIAAEMKQLDSVLVIPCITESEYFKKPTLISVLIMGKKLSDESFSREDINFLDTLANQATITIEYAFIFEELRKNQERLVRSEKLAAVGITTAGVAHELKNPLTYLSAVSQVMAMKWDDPEFKRSVAQMLPAEVQRMQLIISGLLDYSRTKELMLKPLDVKTVVEKTLALLSFEIKKSKVYVKTDYKHAKQANADPNRIMQVFMNLMANAVQAMEKEGGDLVIVTDDADGEVRVSITDTGPGIPKEKIKKVFDPFFTTKESGTGLGLSISKEIVDEHKGSMYVDSDPDKGTTFTVCLPAIS